MSHSWVHYLLYDGTTPNNFPIFSIPHSSGLMMKLPIPASPSLRSSSQTQRRISTRTGCRLFTVASPAAWTMQSSWPRYSTSHTSWTGQLFTLWWDFAGERDSISTSTIVVVWCTSCICSCTHTTKIVPIPNGSVFHGEVGFPLYILLTQSSFPSFADWDSTMYFVYFLLCPIPMAPGGTLTLYTEVHVHVHQVI